MSFWSKLFGSKEPKVSQPVDTPTPVINPPVATAEPEIEQPVATGESQSDKPEESPAADPQPSMESEEPFRQSD